MKKILIILLLLILISSFPVFSQDSVVTEDTALMVPKGQVEFGLFNLLTLGLTDKVSLSTHPVLDALAPNLGVKVNWIDTGSVYFSTKHTLLYPTPLLEFLSGDGVGKILAGDNVYPQIIVIGNNFLVSYVTGDHIFSGRIGVDFALQFPEGTFMGMDYPVLYYTTAVFNTKLSFDAEFSYRWNFVENFWLMPSVEAIILTVPVGPSPIGFEIRQTTNVLWKLNSWFSLSAGYLLAGGVYPYDYDIKLFPLIDVLFSFGGKK